MYVKKKCPACGHWAVFELSIFCHRAAWTCTHCKDSVKNVAWDRQAQQALQEEKARFEELCGRHPQLLELKGTGDHVKLDE